MLPTTAFANLRAKMGWIAKLIDGSKATEALGEDDETFEQWKLEKMKWAREMKIRDYDKVVQQFFCDRSIKVTIQMTSLVIKSHDT